MARFPGFTLPDELVRRRTRAAHRRGAVGGASHGHRAQPVPLTFLAEKEGRGLEVWKPIIAAVNGYCLAGGVTLLFATDIRIAAEHAVFEISEVKRAILPGNGGTQRALRQLPYPIAMEMILLGRRLTAQEALTYGLINKVVPAKELMAAAEEYARRLCENGPLALRAIKELAVRSQSLPLEHGIRLEQAFQEYLRTTEDAKEGPRAFAEKRKPSYKGR